MAVFKVTIYCFDSALIGDNQYTINGHVNAATSDDAWELANEMAEAYVGTLASTTINVYKVGIRNNDVINGNQTRPTDLPGTRAVTGDSLPGWNVMRVEFRDSEGHRPSVFYIRIGVTTDDVTGQEFTTAVKTAAASFVTAMLAVNGFSDPFGAEFTLGEAEPAVQMRQLGWHRRTRPGFHRGWVPNA